MKMSSISLDCDAKISISFESQSRKREKLIKKIEFYTLFIYIGGFYFIFTSENVYLQSQYTKLTLSIHSLLPGDPMKAPPILEVNCRIKCVGCSFSPAHPTSFISLLSPLLLRA